MANTNPLPSTWRFDFGDYTSMGATFQKFLGNLNLFTLAIYNLVNGGLGFANMQRAIYSQTVLAGTTTPLVFANPLPIPPSGIHVVQVLLQGKTQTAMTTAVFAGNFFYDGKNINILNVVGLTQGSTYSLSLEVF
jgi:hypothetical protein